MTVSGRNGSGKSLVLEAIGIVWSAVRMQQHSWDARFFLGSWGDSTDIHLTLDLTDAELEALRSFGESYVSGLPVPPLGTIDAQLTCGAGMPPNLGFDPWFQVLRDPNFYADNRFAQIDHLPADRVAGRGELPQVDPNLLSDTVRAQYRDQITQTYLNQRQTFTMQGIAPLLATSDYVDLLANREGIAPTGDFDAIAEPFRKSTGKTILRPSVDPNSPTGASIDVKNPSGAVHPLDRLSSGEQEVLNLAYFARRLSGRGGVLLIDEPEVHLHPSLQSSLFAQIEEVSERAQVWMVTHSPRMVSLANASGVVHVRPPSEELENQAVRVSDEETRVSLLADLGVGIADVFQGQLLVVVEGPTDRTLLASLMPAELALATIVVASGAGGVDAVARTLTEGQLSYIAVRDRDLLDDSKIEDLKRELPNLFIWNRRCIESELLDPDLIAATFQRAGSAMESPDAATLLRTLADDQLPQITAELVEIELGTRFEVQKSGSTKLERLKNYYQETNRIATEKVAAFDQVTTEVEADLKDWWPQDHLKLADPKRILRQLVAHSPFKSSQSLIDGLLGTIRDSPNSMPAGIAELRVHLDRVSTDLLGQ